MNKTSRERAEELLAEAAERIGELLPDVDATHCYTAGLLHDIGRRLGRFENRHLIDGWRFLSESEFSDCARYCIIEAFVVTDVESLAGRWDCSDEELEFDSLTSCNIYELLPGSLRTRLDKD